MIDFTLRKTDYAESITGIPVFENSSNFKSITGMGIAMYWLNKTCLFGVGNTY